MGLFGPSKRVLKIETMAKDMRKDIAKLEKDLEDKGTSDEKKQESFQFELDTNKKKQEKTYGYLQQHVKQVTPKIETLTETVKDLDQR